MTLPEATVDELHDTWEGIAGQFPRSGPPGLSYWCGTVKGGDLTRTTRDGVTETIGRVVHLECDCLLYRSRKGELVGVLIYFAHDSPAHDPGDVDLVVHPRRRRRGIGRALVAEAERRWGIDWSAQTYTAEGRALVEAHLKENAATH